MGYSFVFFNKTHWIYTEYHLYRKFNYTKLHLYRKYNNTEFHLSQIYSYTKYHQIENIIIPNIMFSEIISIPNFINIEFLIPRKILSHERSYSWFSLDKTFRGIRNSKTFRGIRYYIIQWNVIDKHETRYNYAFDIDEIW